MDKSNVKAFFVVMGSIVVLLAIIMIPALLLNSKKEDKENFPTYNSIKIDKKDLKDSSKYNDIKSTLENDFNFKKEVIIPDYNYKEFSSENLQQLTWNFIFAYELSNNKYLASKDIYNNNFCIKKNHLIDAYKELYNVDITDYLYLLNGYYEYVSLKNNNYCFDYYAVSKDYDNDISLLIESIDKNKDIVTVKLYLFEYYNMETSNELSLVHDLKNFIKRTDISSSKDIVINKLNGTVTHKEIQFIINNGGNHFKYQILNIKTLE